MLNDPLKKNKHFFKKQKLNKIAELLEDFHLVTEFNK